MEEVLNLGHMVRLLMGKNRPQGIMKRQMLTVSNLIRNADRARLIHSVIQFGSALEETYEEQIWFMLYNLGFDSLTSLVFPSQLEMENNVYCWFMLYLKQVTHARGSRENAL